jgi:hypothetical protein
MKREKKRETGRKRVRKKRETGIERERESERMR